MLLGVGLAIRLRRSDRSPFREQRTAPISTTSVRETPLARPPDDRPADGDVGWIEIAGIVSSPNLGSHGAERFLALSPGTSEPGFQKVRVWGRRFPPLLGRVAIVSLFVGRDGRDWSQSEIAKAHCALWRAGSWIEREAIRWNARVNIELASTYFAHVEDDTNLEVAILRPDEWGASGLADPDAEARILGILSRGAASLGFRDPVDLLGRIGARLDADQVVWLLHVRRAGHSLALLSDVTGIPGVAVAVCYADETSIEAPLAGPPFADPTTFVHEIMHLFGASDKYEVSLSTFPRGTVSERDVMVLGEDGLSRLRVDPLTAVEIGWSIAPNERPSGPTLPLRPPPRSVIEKRPSRPR